MIQEDFSIDRVIDCSLAVSRWHAPQDLRGTAEGRIRQPMLADVAEEAVPGFGVGRYFRASLVERLQQGRDVGVMLRVGGRGQTAEDRLEDIGQGSGFAPLTSSCTSPVGGK